MCCDELERDWKRQFLKTERQFSVGPDRLVKDDHLWRWTTLTGKFPPGPNRSIYVWTEISGNFGIMESTPSLHCSALTGKILAFGLGGGGCRLTRGGHIWRFDCIKYHSFVHIQRCSIVLTFHIYDSKSFFIATKVARQAWIVTSIFNFCIIQSISLLCSSTYNRFVKLPREGWNRITISRTV